MLKVSEFKIIQSYVKKTVKTVKIVFQGLRRENTKVILTNALPIVFSFSQQDVFSK